MNSTTTGAIKTIAQAVVWVQSQFGVSYSYWGMCSLFERLQIGKKGRVSRLKILRMKRRRPGKRDLAAALSSAGLTATKRLAWGDEMRLGLCSQVRQA